MRLAIIMAATATAVMAQTADFGKAYSFDERKPQTQVERTVHKLLPSIAKIHGASGLATITPYATGVIVSEQGHIVTLDQILLQRDRTRVVLFDGTVHDAALIRADENLGVRILKINPAEVNGKLQPLWPPSEEQSKYRNGQFVVSMGNCFRLAEFSEKVSAISAIYLYNNT